MKSGNRSKQSSLGLSRKYVDTAPERAMSKAYERILTQEQWESLEALIPAVKPGGRK